MKTKIEPRLLKGFRDFLPEKARKRQYVINTVRQVFEFYGFEPLETPTLEYEEILAGKYGEEGEKLMYRFQDSGDRRVAMRYDQTVPLARVAAQYRETLPLPFKRYQIQNVFRAENPQKGRFREFLQCDIDIVGINSALSDAEILATVADTYSALGFTQFTILLNDRTIFEGIPPVAITIIDKLKKIGEDAVKTQLKEKGLDPDLLDTIKQAKPTSRIQEIMRILAKRGIDNNQVRFEPTLARGLDYYTGVIFEIEIAGYTAGSVGGGGRYNELLGMFMNTSLPAVGFAVGFDRTVEAMEQLDLFPKDLTTSQVLVTIFDKTLTEKSLEIAYFLRSSGINAEVYLDENAKMEKQLKYANKKNIPYVVIIGPDEANKNEATIKNLTTGQQKTIPEEQLLDEIRTVGGKD